jgi:hypothetical protein
VRRPFDHHHRQAQFARHGDLGVGRLAAGIPGDQGLDAV